MILAFDTEVTGLDIRHGSTPFLVTTCDETGNQAYWEWDVDPRTREVKIPKGDVDDVRELLYSADELVTQNGKFDVTALASIGIVDFPWYKLQDTLIAGHLLASNLPHDLTSMALQYLGIDIEPLEKSMEAACQSARRKARKHCKDFRIAKQGLEEMPSAKAKCWKADTWLPKIMAKVLKSEEYESWKTVTRDYANADSATTLAVWLTQKKQIEARGLWAIYRERMKALPIAYRMESHGVTISSTRLDELTKEYREESQKAERVCVHIAESMGYAITLPRGGNNKALVEFAFAEEGLNIPPVKRSKTTGNPSLDKSVLEVARLTLPPKGKALRFVQGLLGKRQRDTAVSYMEGYRRFWKPLEGSKGWYVLHPSLNCTGSNTLRWSSSTPNEQNICVDPETEFLTNAGWVIASELTEEHEVAQYWKTSGKITFTNPELQVSHFKGMMQHITTEQQIDMMLTPEHCCLLQDRKTLLKFDVKAKDFKSDHKHFNAGMYVGGDTRLSQAQVTWLCAVQADGSYVKTDGKIYGITFTFRKGRKIYRLRRCLQALGARYTEKVQRKGGVSFYVGKHEPITSLAQDLMPNKTFGPWLLNCDRETLNRFYKEIFLWDGNSVKKNLYSSSTKENADWVQILFCLSGSRAMLASRMPTSAWSKSVHHYVNVTHDTDTSMTTNFACEQVPWNGPVYCVTVPSSYIVIRRNGKVSITGNSKKEGFNLRYCFGPAPGREWWSLDAKNIELRIPAYEAEEEAFIALFERPDDAPYFGSNHLLVSHILHEREFNDCHSCTACGKEVWCPASATEKRKCCSCPQPKRMVDGRVFKKRYAGSRYQRVKNGNFAVQYGAIDKDDGTGTADRAYGVSGAQARIKARFKKQEALNQKWIRFAEKYGYVETMPDKSVDPTKGYPLLCTRTEWGKILPTVPLNYHVQGTAMWWMHRAMVRVQAKLDEWNHREGKEEYRMVLQVHDELVFDFPKSLVHPKHNGGKGSNLWRVKAIQGLMEQGGLDIGVPTPTSCELHELTWAEGVSCG